MRTLRRVAETLLVVAAVALLAVVSAVVLVPSVMGWVPLTVLSGSMEPTYPTGSQVVVERVDTPEQMATIKAGDVITFLPRPDDATLVTHRVMSVAVTSDGARQFVTRGDNNNAADPNPVGSHQVRGRVLYHVPWVGWVANSLTAENKAMGTIVVAAGLIGYALWHAVRAFLPARRTKASAQ